MNRQLGFTAFLGAAILYGTFGLFVRGLEQDFTPLGQVAVRSFGSMLFAVPWCFLRVKREDLKQLAAPKVWGFGLLFPIGVALWTLAVTLGTVRSSVFGLYLGSLVFSTILGRVLFHERLTKLRVVALVSAFSGALLFSVPFHFDLSVVLGSFAGIFQALLLGYRRNLVDFDRAAITAVQSIGAVILSCAMLLIFSDSGFSVPSVSGVLVGLLYGGIVVTVSNLLLVGSQNLEITTGNVILSTELLWSVVFAALALKEIPNLAEILGCLVLAVGLTASALSTKEH